MRRVLLDIYNNINFNQSTEEVLLFGCELMKRNRHTYGPLPLSLSFLFNPHPDPYAIWERAAQMIAKKTQRTLGSIPTASERIREEEGKKKSTFYH